MPGEITFSMIRQAHAAVCSTVEELEALQAIRLNHMSITTIDNLEVFWDIRELHLAGNMICHIENLEYLSKLEHLDLSNNRISGEALLRGIAGLPKNLQTINLAGNPCAENDSVLVSLQDSLPAVNIIIGLYGDGESVDEADAAISRHLVSGEYPDTEEDALDEEEDEDVEDVDGEGEPAESWVNADDVLQALVERKCRLQGLTTVSVNDAVAELNSEYEVAVKAGAAKSSRRWADVSTTSAVSVNQKIDTYQQRIQAMKDGMKENTARDRQDVDALTRRLQQTAERAMRALDTSI